ncbi:hypothetical protein Tco_0639695 [Tanacetum coccineum]
MAGPIRSKIPSMQSKSVQLVEVGTLKVLFNRISSRPIIVLCTALLSIVRCVEPQSMVRIVMDVLLYIPPGSKYGNANFAQMDLIIVEEEQTQPEYLQELLQSLLNDLQILNEIQPLKQETPNQIQKDQEEKSIVELLAEERFQKDNQVLNEKQSPQEMRIQDLEIQKQQCLEEMKEWMNDIRDLSEYQKEDDCS